MVSEECVQMLDLQLILPSAGSRIYVEIFFKRTNQSVSLSSMSCHNPCVHMAWPTARLRRFRSLTSCAFVYQTAYRTFRQSLVERVPEHVWLRFFPATPNYRHVFTFGVRGSKQLCSWMVLPFDPCMKSPRLCAWLKELATVCESHGFPDLSPKVSWCNAYRNVVSIVSSTYFKTARVG